MRARIRTKLFVVLRPLQNFRPEVPLNLDIINILVGIRFGVEGYLLKTTTF